MSASRSEIVAVAFGPRGRSGTPLNEHVELPKTRGPDAPAAGARPASSAWAGILLEARRSADRLCRRWGAAQFDAEDLACEAIVRLLTALGSGAEIESRTAWVHGTIRHLIADEVRNLEPLRTAGEGAQSTSLACAEAGPCSDPVRSAILRDLGERAPTLFGRLPRPFAEIAELQYLHGATRAQIVGWLGAWRGVHEDEARRLIARTHAMLRSLGREEDLRLRWPRAWDPRKNAWLTTPPRWCDVGSRGLTISRAVA